MRALTCLFVSTFAWNLALGISHIVVALYAGYLGFSAATTGILFGVPVIGQIVLGLVGGATTDRWGGRGTLLVASASFVFAAGVFYYAASFWPFFVGQLCLVVGRGVFWPASQALAAELPGERSLQMGRLNALVNLGQIAGTAGIGLLLAAFGFKAVFLALGVLSAAAFVVTLGLPRIPRKQSSRGQDLFVHFRPLLRKREMYFALLCAYLCAQPISLAQSFYPLLLQSLDFRAEAIGPLMALRALGGAAALLLLARLVGSRHGLRVATVAATLTALAIGLAPFFGKAVPAGLTIAAMGIGAGLLMLYYQLIVSNLADGGTRGSALAIAGSGWSISHGTAPLFMGFIAGNSDLATAFHIWGGLMCALGLTLPFFYRWARPRA